MNNILISSAGRRVSLVKAFQQELIASPVSGVVVACDIQPALSAACQVADKCFEVPRVSDENYIEALLAQCESHEVKLIVPTIDTELLILAENRRRFADRGIEVAVSSPEFIRKCRDKRQIHKFFESANVDVAIEYDKQDYQLPLFIKPIDGSRSQDTYLIQTADQLTAYHFENHKLMFLEYLDHDLHDEFTCDLYYDRTHQLRCVVPRKRIEVRSGEVSKGVSRRNILVPFIRERLRVVDGAIGCLTAQFFVGKNDQSVHGIEINPRFGGGFPLSYLASANFPGWLIREYFMDEEIAEQFDAWEENLLMIRYDDEVLVHGYTD